MWSLLHNPSVHSSAWTLTSASCFRGLSSCLIYKLGEFTGQGFQAKLLPSSHWKITEFRAETLPCLWNSSPRKPPLPQNSKMPPVVWYGYFWNHPILTILGHLVSLSIGFTKDKCSAKLHPTPPSALTWRKLTPPKRVTRDGWPGNPPRWGTPPLMWKQSRKKERLYGEIGNPTKAGNLTNLGSPPPCEQALRLLCIFKALANEDTLLRTHCCPWCFLGCANWETFVADTKCFWTKSETFFVSRTQNSCPQQMLRARANGKHLCRQQCVRNNVSSFARAFRPRHRRHVGGQ